MNPLTSYLGQILLKRKVFMSNDNDSGGIAAIGGVLAVVVLFGVLMKILHGVFIQLTKTFNAFTGVVSSFFGSLWSIAEMTILCSLIVGSVIAAIYFTYKYILLVKRAAEVQKAVTEQLANLKYEIGDAQRDFEERVEIKLNSLSHNLNEALKKPEVLPTSEILAESSEESQTSDASSEQKETADSLEQNAQSTELGTDADLSAVINPY